MTQQKFSFSVESASVIKENVNSNFALVSLDFFASGENLHDMFVSKETLMRTSESIKNCPLTWKYDPTLDDIYTHDKDEVPCGFVPENSKITSRVLEDGRVMLSVTAYVWKRYTGQLLNFFKRDGGKKPVSVEMTVHDTRLLPNGLTELLDFTYECITILGSFVTPAIPLANASVLSFAELEKAYKNDLKEEFDAPEIDMKIPESIKYSAKKGLEFIKENGGGTSVEIANARYLAKNTEISPERARYMSDHFANHNFSQLSPPSDTDLARLLWGGDTARDWIQSIIDKLKEGELLTFPYKTIGDANPALRGISPPITVAQANAIARQADAIGTDGKANGWAIAISSFKKTHTVKDGKWVKKNTEEMEMSMEENKVIQGTEEVAEVIAPVETPVVEEVQMAEPEVKEKDEEEKPAEKKFEFPKNFNLETMGKLFSDDGDEDDDVKMAKEEVQKGEFANPSIMMAGMFAKMCKMADAMVKMAEESKVYMAENEELKKFKADLEKQQKAFEVEKFMKELTEKVIVPAEAKEEMLAEAEKFAFAELDTWKQGCKAKSFDFAVKEENSKSDVIVVGLPFGASTEKKKDDLWASSN